MIQMVIKISEAITTIKKAESDADKLIDDAKKRSSEMIEKAKEKSEKIIEDAKNEAYHEAETIKFEAENKAKEEVHRILKETDESIEITRSKTTDLIDRAVDIIIKSVL